jgi:hypothetical protein
MPPAKKKKSKPEGESIYTVVRLAYDATLARACELAGIDARNVNIVQKAGEKLPTNLSGDFRIVSFDGIQVTISERINGERRARGFAVPPTI